jgi:hypothetical protein
MGNYLQTQPQQITWPQKEAEITGTDLEQAKQHMENIDNIINEKNLEKLKRYVGVNGSRFWNGHYALSQIEGLSRLDERSDSDKMRIENALQRYVGRREVLLKNNDIDENK